jgi:hypothetical protein
MNERILALAEQAGYIGRGSNHTAYMNFDHETFAELIVKECANRATWAQDTGAKDIGGEVLKHFGVEE